VQRLRRLSRRRAARQEEGAFVVEGPLLVAEALQAGLAVEQVLVAADDGFSQVVELAGHHGVPVHTVVAEVLAKSLDATTPPGVAAIVARPEIGLDAAVAAAAAGALTLVLVDVADPGNAGTLLRAAEASGASAVLFCGASVDPCNPKCVRASAGALFHLPVASGGEAVAVLERLGDAGVRRMATVVRGGTPYDEADLAGPVAVVLGSEAHGLPDHLDHLVDERLTIPMAGRSESLNVAMAGSVLCFESLRQRRGAP
jgi:TrmH family RNA methyltransferase